jgi:hypothetical protein
MSVLDSHDGKPSWVLTMTRVGIPLGLFVFLVTAARNDGYFRDEFYYVACSYRLDWGYVDHPPLSVAILWIVRHFAGDSLATLRVTAAVISALTVLTTCSIARRLGASAFGQTVAMIATATAPLLLATGSFYSMNVSDLLIWTTVARVMIEVLDEPTSTRWVFLGLIVGLGLENKLSVLWLGAGLFAGFAMTRARGLLLTQGPWMAGLTACAVFAPHVIWQFAHGWPTLEFIQNASRGKMLSNTPVQFWASQVLNMNPLTLPVWLAGLLYLLFSPRANSYRPLGVTFLVVAGILMINRTSRSTYLAAAYPLLFAAGGVALELVFERRAWRATVIAVLLISGAITAPLAVPLLSTQRYAQYTKALGFAPSTEERKEVGRLPQFFADREGWERFVEQVSAVFDRLSPSEQTRVAVLAPNYGEAGAIELLGRSRGIVAISGHNSYWWWGTAGRSGEVLIVLSRSRELQEERFASVEKAGDIDCGDCMPYENGLSIFICRGMRLPLLANWASLKHYD